jgi:hypothetical protein
VNGRSVALKSAQSDSPVIIDISDLVTNGDNSIKMSGASRLVGVQAVADYYVPWDGTVGREAANATNSGLQIAVKFEKTQANTGDPISCPRNVDKRK